MPNRRALVALLLLVWLAAGFLGGEGFALDQSIRSPLLWTGTSAAALIALTHLGGWHALLPVTLAAALALFLTRRRSHALLLVAAALTGRLLIDAQKLLTARIRPPLADHLVGVENLSFPSGHSGNATITYLLIALLFAPRAPAVALALLLALAIGLSRVMLGVHWPTDVVGGWAFGAAFALTVVGTARAAGWLEGGKEIPMSENNRTETARDHDDSDLIESMEDAPDQSGASGGNLQRDIGTRAEEEHRVDGKPGVTRVRASDKPEEANLPRFNESN